MAIELDNREFQNVWKLVAETNSSVFMTGRAGTGKSTFLRYIVENIHKKTVVLAPTGIAAVNAGGVTLHSFFKIPLQPFAPDDVNFSTPRRMKEMQKFNSEKITLINQVELIVIDEISMVRADVLDFIDRVLRTYVKGGRNLPFGGKQLLLVGDAFQLEPVTRSEDWDILRRFYGTPYFFGAMVFRQIALVQIELCKVYRQKETDFLSLLDKVRIGSVQPDDLGTINSRVNPTFAPEGQDLYITLTATRASCDAINEKHLEDLVSDEVVYEGVVQGDFPEAARPTNMLLTLKKGAQVVFLRNDNERRWFNGTIGRVDDLEEDGVWVFVETEAPDDDGEAVVNRYFVEKATWENVRYRYDEQKHKVVTELLGTFSQVPLQLAWAITIHKSQGLSFDRAIIDLGRGAFACGQVYVALSRCRTLAGLVLRQPVSMNDIKTNGFVRTFASGANDESLISRELEVARAYALLDSASAAFDVHDFRRAVSDFMDAAALMPDYVARPQVRRLVARRLAVVDKLQAQIDFLLREREAQKQKNFEFAYEYFLLASECLRKYDDARAAKANVNKALGLSPDYADALALRAELNLAGGDLDAAVADASSALKDESLKSRKKANVLRLRADAYCGLLQWQNAYLDYQDVLRITRDDKEVMSRLSKVCSRLGLDDEASAWLGLSLDDDGADDE